MQQSFRIPIRCFNAYELYKEHKRIYAISTLYKNAKFPVFLLFNWRVCFPSYKWHMYMSYSINLWRHFAVCPQSDKNWYFVTAVDGRSGFVPRNYVQPLQVRQESQLFVSLSYCLNQVVFLYILSSRHFDEVKTCVHTVNTVYKAVPYLVFGQLVPKKLSVPSSFWRITVHTKFTYDYV